jgi:pimeloyl-ACP methyl ester carboxylesterase
MLHGGGLDAAGLSLGRTIPVLASRYRVFAPDWPGFGRSGATPIRWRVEECVEFLADLVGALGLKRTSPRELQKFLSMSPNELVESDTDGGRNIPRHY